ncbi:MAG: hypothetical protein H7343_12845, partial [Undibacterium sp.]|nr:hypothetical protein [Opitutaceae bacterium]
MRRLLRFTFGLVALLLLALATLPWWLGLILPVIGRSHGVAFNRYERVSYTRFALETVVVRASTTSVNVTRVEADSPLIWLWRRALGQPGAVIVGKWRVEVVATPPSPTPTPAGWLPLRARLQNIFRKLTPWLPRAQLGSGTVRWPGGGFSLASATWQDAVLKLQDFHYGPVLASGELTLFAKGQDLIQLTAALNSAPLRTTLESRAADLTGQLLFFEDQPALLTAQFNPTGWLPATATLRADAWSLPGARLPRGEAYARIHGASRLEWREGQLTVDFSANGEPAPGRATPPLAAQLHGRSDGAALRVETLHLTLPGLQADLTQPVVIDRTGKLLSGDSRFTLTADLAAWPQLATQGTVNGEVHVTPGSAQLPHIEFKLAAKALAFRDWRVSTASTEGRLDWPQLQLTAVSIESANGDRLTGGGGWDFSTQTLRDAQLAGKVARLTVAPWLPANLDFATLALKLRANGPLATLVHTGEADLTSFVAQPLKPLALTVQWQGLGRTVEKFTATATTATGTTRLKAVGTLDVEKLTLTELALTVPSTTTLQLSQPATLRWKPALQLAGLTLASADTSLTAWFTLGDAGQFNAAIKNLSSAALTDLLEVRGPAWRITTLAAQGTWDRGPLTFTTTTEASVALS